MAFTSKEQEVIKWGMANGKPLAEIQDAVFRLRTTGSPVNPNKKPEPSPTFVQDLAGDVRETGAALSRTLETGLQRQADINTATKESIASGTPFTGSEGGQSIFRSVPQAIGAGAGTVSSAIGDVVTGVAKAAVPQSVEDTVSSGLKSALQYVMQTAPAKYAQSIYESLSPAAKRDVQAIGGTVSLGADLLGVGAGKKIVSEGIARSPSFVDDSVRSATKLTSPVVEVTVPSAPKGSVLSNLIQDIIPSTNQLRDGMVAKAFRLAPIEDVSRIKQLTGNDIGDFLARNDLIKSTTKETADALDSFYKQNYTAVRDLVAISDEKLGVPFQLSDMPEASIIIDDLISEFSKSSAPTFVENVRRLKAIKDSGTIDLMQLQDAKSLFDRVKSIYKRTGEVRPSIQAQASDDSITAIRRFIENEVKQQTGVDVGVLNNNVMTAREIADAFANRTGKADTARFVSLTDLSTLGFGTMVDPLAGVTALSAKRVLEAPSTMLRVAQWLSGRSGAINGADRSVLDNAEKLIRDELNSILKDTSAR